MNEHPLPMFEEVPTTAEPKPPKKPKPKPTRKRRKRKAAKAAAPKPVGRPRKKRRAVKLPLRTPPARGVYPPAVYRLIADLMNLDVPLRNFIVEIAKGIGESRDSK